MPPNPSCKDLISWVDSRAMFSLLINILPRLILIIMAYIEPNPPKADKAIIGSIDIRAKRITTSMIDELISVKAGVMIAPMTLLALVDIPLITSLLFREACIE